MKQLDKKSVWLFFVSFLMSAIAFSAFIIMFGLPLLLDTKVISIFVFVVCAVLVFLVFAAIAFIWAKLSYRFYKYELTDLGFRKESGVIYKKYVTIPYARIQNVDINRGIIARLLGLSDLQIQTAGASATVTRYGAMGINAEGRLPGVSVADAETLRDELIRRASRTGGQGM